MKTKDPSEWGKRRQLDWTEIEPFGEKELILEAQRYWQETGGGLALNLKLTQQQYDSLPERIKQPNKVMHDFGWAAVEKDKSNSDD